MAFKKYNWVGNLINDNDMCLMYQIKEIDKITITKQVAEAVKDYVTKKKTTEQTITTKQLQDMYNEYGYKYGYDFDNWKNLYCGRYGFIEIKETEKSKTTA